MRHFHLLALVSALVALSGCSGSNLQGRPYALPSGRAIRVLGVTTLHFAGGAPPALLFQYQTDLKISDMNSLRKEAEEIWTILRVDADKRNFDSAIISANEVPSGLVFKSSKGFRFIYEKRAGIWHSLDAEKNTLKN
jgi:hypothetical protein